MLTWDYLGVVAKDVRKSVQFYRLLGIDLPEIEDDHIETTLANGMRFAVDSLDMIKSLGWWEEPVGNRMGMAFRAESTQGVDDAYNKIVSSGFQGKTEPFDAFWGHRYAQVLDPDGNSVDIYAPLESEQS